MVVYLYRLVCLTGEGAEKQPASSQTGFSCSPFLVVFLAFFKPTLVFHYSLVLISSESALPSPLLVSLHHLVVALPFGCLIYCPLLVQLATQSTEVAYSSLHLVSGESFSFLYFVFKMKIMISDFEGWLWERKIQVKKEEDVNLVLHGLQVTHQQKLFYFSISILSLLLKWQTLIHYKCMHDHRFDLNMLHTWCQ